MTRRRRRAVAALLLLSGCGAAGSGRDAALRAADVRPGERAWLVSLHQDGLAHLRYGGLAVRKGGTAAVRRAGSVLVADQGRLGPEVIRTAGRLGVGLPRAERVEQLALARRLADEVGGGFDRDFVAVTAADHERAIARTEDRLRDGSSPELTALARGVLPTLRARLAMLRRADPVS
jgi:predicted outer membrane protein